MTKNRPVATAAGRIFVVGGAVWCPRRAITTMSPPHALALTTFQT
jgi:hypothetical protein